MDKARRRTAVLAALEDQLDSNEAPEVRGQLDRLLSLGHSKGEAKEMMATILLFYMQHTLKEDGYTYDDYISELSNLPDIDWRE